MRLVPGPETRLDLLYEVFYIGKQYVPVCVLEYPDEYLDSGKVNLDASLFIFLVDNYMTHFFVKLVRYADYKFL